MIARYPNHGGESPDLLVDKLNEIIQEVNNINDDIKELFKRSLESKMLSSEVKRDLNFCRDEIEGHTNPSRPCQDKVKLLSAILPKIEAQEKLMEEMAVMLEAIYAAKLDNDKTIPVFKKMHSLLKQYNKLKEGE